MKAEDKIKRHGYHLMSLASIGMFVVALLALILATTPLMPAKTTHVDHVRFLGFDIADFMQASDNNQWVFTGAALCMGLAYFLPFLALRRLGYCLYHNEALTLPIAKAFRWLAHSIVACIVLQALPDMYFGISHDFGLNTTYITVIACLCLYSVSHLMKLAAEAADDARSIV